MASTKRGETKRVAAAAGMRTACGWKWDGLASSMNRGERATARVEVELPQEVELKRPSHKIVYGTLWTGQH
jgi:hypothetical protein